MRRAASMAPGDAGGGGGAASSGRAGSAPGASRPEARASVILAFDQLLVFRRACVLAPQLRAEALFARAVAQVARDAQRQPQRFGRGFGDAVEALHQRARIANLSAAELEL